MLRALSGCAFWFCCSQDMRTLAKISHNSRHESDFSKASGGTKAVGCAWGKHRQHALCKTLLARYLNPELHHKPSAQKASTWLEPPDSWRRRSKNPLSSTVDHGRSVTLCEEAARSLRGARTSTGTAVQRAHAQRVSRVPQEAFVTVYQRTVDNSRRPRVPSIADGEVSGKDDIPYCRKRGLERCPKPVYSFNVGCSVHEHQLPSS